MTEHRGRHLTDVEILSLVDDQEMRDLLAEVLRQVCFLVVSCQAEDGKPRLLPEHYEQRKSLRSLTAALDRIAVHFPEVTDALRERLQPVREFVLG